MNYDVEHRKKSLDISKYEMSMTLIHIGTKE